jgi:phosphoglycolate phosphatase-like HAD superfamily hydrolase
MKMVLQNNGKRLSHIGLDVDGVIRDTSQLITMATKVALKNFGIFHEMDPHEEGRIRGLSGYGTGVSALKALVAIHRSGVSPTTVLRDDQQMLLGRLIKETIQPREEELFNKSSKEWRCIFDSENAWSMVVPIPRSVESIRLLKSAGYMLSAVSSSTGISVKRDLRKFGIFEDIDVVISKEDVTKRKPDPEGILVAAEMVMSDPEEMAYVGDREEDIQAAKAAGVGTSVAVLSGQGERTRLLSAKPTYLFPDLYEFTVAFCLKQEQEAIESS